MLLPSIKYVRKNKGITKNTIIVSFGKRSADECNYEVNISTDGPIFKCHFQHVYLDTLKSWNDLIAIVPDSLYVVYNTPDDTCKAEWDHELFIAIHSQFSKIRDIRIDKVYTDRIFYLTLSALRGIKYSYKMYNTIILGNSSSGKTYISNLISLYFSQLLRITLVNFTDTDSLKKVQKTLDFVLHVDKDIILKDLMEIMDSFKISKYIIVVTRINETSDIPDWLHCYKNFAMIIKLKINTPTKFRIVLQNMYPKCRFTASDAILNEIFAVFTDTTAESHQTINFADMALVVEECQLLLLNKGNITIFNPDWLTVDLLRQSVKQRQIHVMREKKENIPILLLYG